MNRGPLLLVVGYVAFFCSSPNAKDFALVIGGMSVSQSAKSHEFARQALATTLGLRHQGFEVTTLFGGEGEKSKFTDDYSALKGEGIDRAATETNIQAALKQMTAQAKPGDRVEFVILAHGYSKCPEASGGAKTFSGTGHTADDLDPSCSHEIGVSAPDGSMVKIDSSLLSKAVKELDKKGVKTHFVLNSCYSGRLKKDLKDLTHGCAYFPTAGNNYAYACFEEDPPELRDFTSTTEIILARRFRAISDDLQKRPYFKSSSCFSKVYDFIKSSEFDWTSLSSTFWSARRTDDCLQEPALSSTLSNKWFSTGHFSTLADGTDRCRPAVAHEIDQLLTDTASAEAKLLQDGFRDALKAYNDQIAVQKAAIKAFKDDDPKTLEAIQDAQAKSKELAVPVIKAERLLVDHYQKTQSTKGDDPCSDSW